MKYNSHSRNIMAIKGRSMVGGMEYYATTRGIKSAKESLEDPRVQNELADDLKQYVAAQAYDAIVGGKLFFTQDPAAAYDEFVQLLQDPEVRRTVIKNLKSRFTTRHIDESVEEYEQRKAYKDYCDAGRDVLALKQEVSYLERRVDEMKDDLDARYPGKYKSTIWDMENPNITEE